MRDSSRETENGQDIEYLPMHQVPVGSPRGRSGQGSSDSPPLLTLFLFKNKVDLIAIALFLFSIGKERLI